MPTRIWCTAVSPLPIDARRRTSGSWVSIRAMSDRSAYVTTSAALALRPG